MKQVNYKFISIVENGDGSPEHPSYDVKNNKSGELLGAVEYYEKWRKYNFYPESNTGYDHECLSNICHFLTTHAGKP